MVGFGFTLTGGRCPVDPGHEEGEVRPGSPVDRLFAAEGTHIGVELPSSGVGASDPRIPVSLHTWSRERRIRTCSDLI